VCVPLVGVPLRLDRRTDEGHSTVYREQRAPLEPPPTGP
jgi:hypothetical protein